MTGAPIVTRLPLRLRLPRLPAGMRRPLAVIGLIIVVFWVVADLRGARDGAVRPAGTVRRHLRRAVVAALLRH